MTSYFKGLLGLGGGAGQGAGAAMPTGAAAGAAPRAQSESSAPLKMPPRINTNPPPARADSFPGERGLACGAGRQYEI